MFFTCKLYLIFAILSKVTINFGSSYMRRDDQQDNNIKQDSLSNESKEKNNKLSNSNQCWMNLNSEEYIKAMDKLDERYAQVRQEYQDAAEKDKFDKKMLKVMLKTRGAAEREIQRVAGDSGQIPAGINLGGYFMMRMPNSLLFFHRMKLRNNTHFRVISLRNDLVNLTLRSSLSLNDLHLVGSFDRSITDKDPSILFYTPTYGEVEFLFKNVQYTFEGRYRLLKDRLNIEMMISDIEFDDVMMTYVNNTKNEAVNLQRRNIEDFLTRLKSDLDKWLKDYFNDYLIYFGLVGKNSNNEFQQYDKERAKQLNNYTDHVVDLLTQRLQEVKSDSVKLPRFTIYTANSMELLLKDGVLRGLDSMYRRSVATGIKVNDIRKIDAVIGFSNLKVIYHYEALLATNSPVLRGMMILSADELTAHMGVVVMEDSKSIQIEFEFLEQVKPESLTIEGPANRMISNFKYILEQHIIAIMSNTLLFNIKKLGSLTKCVPLLNGEQDPKNIILEAEVNNSDAENNHEQSASEDPKPEFESTKFENSELEPSDKQQLAKSDIASDYDKEKNSNENSKTELDQKNKS